MHPHLPSFSRSVALSRSRSWALLLYCSTVRCTSVPALSLHFCSCSIAALLILFYRCTSDPVLSLHFCSCSIAPHSRSALLLCTLCSTLLLRTSTPHLSLRTSALHSLLYTSCSSLSAPCYSLFGFRSALLLPALYSLLYAPRSLLHCACSFMQKSDGAKSGGRHH
jgi:hypothetical protein